MITINKTTEKPKTKHNDTLACLNFWTYNNRLRDVQQETHDKNNEFTQM